MRRFESAITLPAAPDAVWHHMRDVVHWPQWMETFERVEPLDAHELALRRRFRVAQPRLRTAVWTVTRLENASFTWESRSPGLRMVADHVLEPCAMGTRVRLHFGFEGLLSPIVARLFGSLVQRYLALECTAYERRLSA